MSHGSTQMIERKVSARIRARAQINRRRLLKLAGIATAALAAPSVLFRACAAELKPVTLTLDWIYQGPNAGFMVALDKGFYREAGLDVAMTPGKGSASTAQLIASKAAQFGFADGYVLGNSVARGMALKNIGGIYRRNPAGIMVLSDSDITTPKDLEGKTVGLTAGSAQFQQWPAFCKGAGVDASKVEVVNVDPAGVSAALISGKVPAIGGFVQGYVPSIEIRGKKEARVFYFADYGVTVVSNGIIVHDDLLKNDPELLRAFVTPTIKGFLYARKIPTRVLPSSRSIWKPSISGSPGARWNCPGRAGSHPTPTASRLGGAPMRIGPRLSTCSSSMAALRCRSILQPSIQMSLCRPVPNSCRRRRFNRRRHRTMHNSEPVV